LLELHSHTNPFRFISENKRDEQVINLLGEWAVENEMKINPGKSKGVSFTKARVKERIWYYFRDQLIPKASSFKYLRIIVCNDLNREDHSNSTPRKARHFIS
jgi:hypothetical protein